MPSKILSKYTVLKEAGAIFASAITSDYIELGNYQTIDFIVATGVGTAANTTIKVKAKQGASGTPEDITFSEQTGPSAYATIEATGKTFSIGGTAGECGFIIIRVNADRLKGLYDRVAINTTAVASSTVPGSIVAAIYEPRYSE